MLAKEEGEEIIEGVVPESYFTEEDVHCPVMLMTWCVTKRYAERWPRIARCIAIIATAVSICDV